MPKKMHFVFVLIAYFTAISAHRCRNSGNETRDCFRNCIDGSFCYIDMPGFRPNSGTCCDPTTADTFCTATGLITYHSRVNNTYRHLWNESLAEMGFYKDPYTDSACPYPYLNDMFAQSKLLPIDFTADSTERIRFCKNNTDCPEQSFCGRIYSVVVGGPTNLSACYGDSRKKIEKRDVELVCPGSEKIVSDEPDCTSDGECLNSSETSCFHGHCCPLNKTINSTIPEGYCPDGKTRALDEPECTSDGVCSTNSKALCAHGHCCPTLKKVSNETYEIGAATYFTNMPCENGKMMNTILSYCHNSKVVIMGEDGFKMDFSMYPECTDERNCSTDGSVVCVAYLDQKRCMHNMAWEVNTDTSTVRNMMIGVIFLGLVGIFGAIGGCVFLRHDTSIFDTPNVKQLLSVSERRRKGKMILKKLVHGGFKKKECFDVDKPEKMIENSKKD